MLDRFNFKQKIVLLLASVAIGMVAITTVATLQTRQDILEGRQTALRTAVQTAYNIVQGFQAKAAAGTMPVEEAKAAAAEAVRMSRYGGPEGKTDYFYILQTDGVGVMHPIIKTWADRKQLMGNLNKQGVDTVKLMVDAARDTSQGFGIVNTMVARPGDTSPDAVTYPKRQYLMVVPGWNWIVGSGLYMDDVEAQVRAAAFKQLGIGLAVLVAIGLLGALITRSVLSQLGGDPEQTIAIMTEVAAGNLAVKVPAAPNGSLLDELRRAVESIRGTLVQVSQAADSITTASAEIADGNQNLATRTEQAASNLQQAASAMEELNITVKQSAESANQANHLASSAADVAQRGGKVVSAVVATMNDINASSKKIGDIIGVIDGIAFQTNILALNAAVEAARAGEQGRGFAVVASEVRSLAQRSAEAAKEIKSLISASVEKVEAGSKLVGDAGDTMQEIVGSVKKVTDVIGEITTSAMEQSTGIGLVNTSVNELDNMTQQNAALVEQSAAAAESLKDQAVAMAHVVSTFRLN